MESEVNTDARNRQEETAVPQTPLLLIIAALLFVPGLYGVLLLSAALIAAIGGGVVYAVYYMFTHLSRALVFRLAIVAIPIALGSLWGLFAVIAGLLRSVFRGVGFSPAIVIPLRRERRLHALVTDLCERLGTQIPNSLLLHAEPTFEVMQGKHRVFNGVARGRVLAVGVPLLGGLTVNEVRAILAHELAHFTGRDTLYSAFVQPVYSGIGTAAGAMEGMPGDDDPTSNVGAWMALPLLLPKWIMTGYLRSFHSIMVRIGQAQERRADMLAAFTCGKQSCSMGLRKFVGISGTFWDVGPTHILEACSNGKPYENYYATFRSKLPELAPMVRDHEAQARSWLGAPGEVHPPLSQRLEYLPEVPEQYDDTEAATALLENLDQYERTLTTHFTRYAIMMTMAAAEDD